MADFYLSWRDENGNGYPVANAYTITGLDANACYKERVRALWRQRGWLD